MNAIRATAYALLVSLAATSAPSLASSQVKQADTPRNIVLVELFTSEGCSSCPPADDLLRKMNATQTPAGQEVIGISEHVTYWNRLGWTDPFSSSTYTDRQERYANRFGLDSAYTPQMVVNGEQQFVGSNEASLKEALAHPPKQKAITLQILSAEVHDSAIAIHFAAKQLVSNHPLDVVAVLTEDLTGSRVLRGENSGRSLHHVAVARSLTTVATIQHNTDTTVSLPLTTSHGVKRELAHHLILFAQERNQGAIVGVDRKPLILSTAYGENL